MPALRRRARGRRGDGAGRQSGAAALDDADGGTDRHPRQSDHGQRARQEAPIDWFERTLTASVPLRYPGAFRRVYPGFVQLVAFMSMNIERHVKAHKELYEHLANGELEKAAVTKAFYDEYFAVLDLTAEFYLETVRLIFQEHALPRGELEWHGETGRSERDPQDHAVHGRGRARRHLRRRPDRRRARSVQQAAALSEAPPHAGRRRPLRRVLRQALGEPDLSDPQERDLVEQLSAYRIAAAILPPSTVVTSAVVFSASA